MTTNNIIVITSNHHLYSVLSKLEVPFYTLNSPTDIDILEDHKDATLIDLTIFNTADKEVLLKSIPDNYKVISDFSCSWGEYLSEKYPNVVGSFASAFYSPKKCFEIYSQNEKIKEQVSDFFKLVGIATKSVSTPGHGFIMPRTLSMIINEAYFSLEDELALSEDIDTAMKFGVNYPLGPLEWAEKSGLIPVRLLLDDLYGISHDKRYKLSTYLRHKSSLK